PGVLIAEVAQEVFAAAGATLRIALHAFQAALSYLFQLMLLRSGGFGDVVEGAAAREFDLSRVQLPGRADFLKLVDDVAQFAAGERCLLDEIVAAGGTPVVRENAGHRLQRLRIHVTAAGLVLLSIDVLGTVEKHRFRPIAIAPGAADLLVITVEGIAHVTV